VLLADSSAPSIAIGLLLIPLLVAVNAFFVAAEFALVAVRRTRVEELANQGDARAKVLLQGLDDLDDRVAAAQLGITVASLALSLACEPALHHLLAPLFAALPDAVQGAISKVASLALTLGAMTYLHVVFGEQMPKLAALQTSEAVALRIAGPLAWFARTVRPVTRLLNGSSNLFLRWCGYRPGGEHAETPTVDEMRLLIEDQEEAGLIDPEAADYVLNVFELSSKRVADVMVPWDKVMTLDLDTPPDKVLEAVREGAHTRMPVTAGRPPAVVGLVNTKDLFYLFSLKGVVVLEDAIYPAQYLAPTDSVADALRRFRKSHRPMAVVREAGGPPLGILTLEDVLEEIVGDLEDEQDDPARRRQLRARAARRRRPPPLLPPSRPGPTGGAGRPAP
jgi:CBS domain containing-hemolysin-like protein